MYSDNEKYEIEDNGKRTGKFFYGIEFNMYMRSIRLLLTNLKIDHEI